ncbi:MAG TPA: DUF4129 domain-containing protein [Rhizomicrobium sp.]
MRHRYYRLARDFMPGTLQTSIENTDKVAQAHARLLQAGDLQFAFPIYHQPKTPEWAQSLGRILKAMGPYMLDLFWVVVAAGALVLAYYIGREVLRRRGWFVPTPGASQQPWPEWRPTPEQARLLLADADRLAGQGQYREATHLLLLRSIQDVDDRRPQLVRPALTTREIAALDQMPLSARGCFADIAHTVEQGLFGGREVSAQDFARCRDAYERFALPNIWLAEQAA